MAHQQYSHDEVIKAFETKRDNPQIMSMKQIHIVKTFNNLKKEIEAIEKGSK